MKSFATIKTLILALTLLTSAISVPATERPFSCNGNGSATFTTDSEGHIIGGKIQASGTATHLGLWTATGTLIFTDDNPNDTLVYPSGEATFTAANGDKLEVILEQGVMDLSTGIGRGNFRFAGGTGRFQNANGLAQLVVVQNLVTGAFEFTVVGSVDF